MATNNTVHIGDSNRIRGKDNTISSERGKEPRWLIIGVVACLLIAGLAWGMNRFRFAGIGVEGNTIDEVQNQESETDR